MKNTQTPFSIKNDIQFEYGINHSFNILGFKGAKILYI